MHVNTLREIRKVMDFIGIPKIAESALIEAIEFSSFSNMRHMESQNTLNTRRLSTNDVSDPEAFKTRSGKVGGFRSYFSEATMIKMNQRLSGVIPALYGYDFQV
jgi:hypothetical protein